MHYYRIEYKIGEKKYLADHQAPDIQTALQQLSIRVKRKNRAELPFTITGWKRLK